jgi:hypothetical protein
MNGIALEKTEEEVDIGVAVNKSLKPSAQCKRAAKTAQTVLAQLTRAFHFRDRHIFVRLYVQYVRPHLEFSTPAWAPWHEADKETLEKVQKRAVNMVSGLRGKNYEEKLQELGLQTLEERRIQADMVQVYKILNGKDKVNKDTWFKMMQDGERVTRATSDPLNIQAQYGRLDIRRNFFTHRVVEQWNKIPEDLKNARTVQSFRKGYQALRLRP